jgi:hypothetical protein
MLVLKYYKVCLKKTQAKDLVRLALKRLKVKNFAEELIGI